MKLRRLWDSFWNLFHKDEIEKDLDAELQAFVEMVADEKVATGTAKPEARRQARAEFGGVEQVKQAVRDRRSGAGIEIFWQDLRFGLRQLRNSPVFTVVAILTLGIGIGANTAIFSFVNSVLLRPLPYPDPERLTMIWSVLGNSGRAPASMFELYQMRQRTREFDQISGIWVTNRALPGKGDAVQGKAGVVTSNYLPLFCSRPALGRFFRPEDDLENAPATIILSHELWTRRFSSNPNIIGTSVPYRSASAIVIGVLPRNFKLMLPGDASVPVHVDYFESIPIGPWQPDGPGFLHLVGRLRDAGRLAAAKAELSSIGDEINAMGGRTRVANYRLYAVPLQDDDVREVRHTLLILFGAVAFVLLIGCANVGNLLMVRARQRLQETTIRAALGATHRRLIRQFSTETMLLVFAGGAAALLLGWAALKIIVAVEPPSFANLGSVNLDLRVLGFTFAIAILTGILFALAPLSTVRHLNLAADLKRTARSATRRQGPAARVLVAGEVALAFVLMIGTGLLVRTFANILHVNPGFRADGVFAFRMNIPDYETLREVERALTSLPGVQSVSTVSHLPLDDTGNWYDYYWKEGTPSSQQNTVMADNRSVSPGYFNTVGAQIVQGRDFTDADDAAHQHVVVIDDVLASNLWPGQEAIGKRLNVSDSPKGPYQFERDWVVVVGVVRHIQCHVLTANVRPQIYLPYPLAPRPSMALVMRSSGAAPALAASVRKRISDLNRSIPITPLEPLSAVVDRALAESRFVSVLASLLSIVALQLALGGIFGVLSYSVVARTTEIGIRMALGARRIQIMCLVFREGFLPVTIGVLAGLGLSVVSMPLLEHMLFEIRPESPQNYEMITLAIVVLCAMAMTVPSLRAVRIEPATALAAD
jgi:putative ABC transport system permease protein